MDTKSKNRLKISKSRLGTHILARFNPDRYHIYAKKLKQILEMKFNISLHHSVHSFLLDNLIKTGPYNIKNTKKIFKISKSTQILWTMTVHECFKRIIIKMPNWLQRCWWRILVTDVGDGWRSSLEPWRFFLATTSSCWWPILYTEKIPNVIILPPTSWNYNYHRVTDIPLSSLSLYPAKSKQ